MSSYETEEARLERLKMEELEKERIRRLEEEKRELERYNSVLEDVRGFEEQVTKYLDQFAKDIQVYHEAKIFISDKEKEAIRKHKEAVRYIRFRCFGSNSGELERALSDCRNAIVQAKRDFSAVKAALDGKLAHYRKEEAIRQQTSGPLGSKTAAGKVIYEDVVDITRVKQEYEEHIKQIEREISEKISEERLAQLYNSYLAEINIYNSMVKANEKVTPHSLYNIPSNNKYAYLAESIKKFKEQTLSLMERQKVLEIIKTTLSEMGVKSHSGVTLSSGSNLLHTIHQGSGKSIHSAIGVPKSNAGEDEDSTVFVMIESADLGTYDVKDGDELELVLSDEVSDAIKQVQQEFCSFHDELKRRLKENGVIISDHTSHPVGERAVKVTDVVRTKEKSASSSSSADKQDTAFKI